MAMAMDEEPPSPTTRAVERVCFAGTSRECAHCGETVGFQARRRHHQVIANIYVKLDARGRRRTLKAGQYGGQWDRVEHWHPECYREAGEPYGSTKVYVPDYRNMTGKK